MVTFGAFFSMYVYFGELIMATISTLYVNNDKKAGKVRGYKVQIRKGNRTIKCKNFKKKANAITWQKRIEGDREKMQALDLPGTGITLAELIKEVQAERGTESDFRTKFWVKKLGDYKLTDITSHLIRFALKEYASGNAQRGNGLKYDDETSELVRLTKSIGRKRAPSTINRMKSGISSLLDYAVGEEYLTENPALRVKTKKEDNKRRRYLSDSELKALLSASSASLWPKLRLLVNYGCLYRCEAVRNA